MFHRRVQFTPSQSPLLHERFTTTTQAFRGFQAFPPLFPSHDFLQDNAGTFQSFTPAILVINVIVDVLYAILDPRITFS